MVGLLNLEHLGWCKYFSDQIDLKKEDDLYPVRVIAIHKGECNVSDGNIIHSAKMTGRLRHHADSRLDYPTVGDWVLVKSFNQGEFSRIQRVLGRQTVLKRKTSGRTSNEQLIASNIDNALIIQSVDKSFNLNRIERYLVMVNESMIKPILILTKIDLCLRIPFE